MVKSMKNENSYWSFPKDFSELRSVNELLETLEKHSMNYKIIGTQDFLMRCKTY